MVSQDKAKFITIFIINLIISFLFLILMTYIIGLMVFIINEYKLQENKTDNLEIISNNHQFNEFEYIPKAPVNVSSSRIENESKKELNDEIYLLAQLIYAEARGESYEGKIAVGNVVLNRVKSDSFPDTIHDVIYQKRQFSPVSNGSIHNTPDEESIKAAIECFEINLVGGALYFYNPELSNPNTQAGKWIRTRKVIKQIGSHIFAM